MFTTLLLVVLCCYAALSNAASYNPASLSKFNDFVKTPHSNPSARAGDVTIHTGGRLITRHLEYLAQAGYKSVLSVSDFSTNDTLYNGVPGDFPSSTYEMSLLSSYGLQAATIPSSMTVDSVKAISKVMSEMPKPLYVHCHVGYTANLFTQLHFYLENQLSSSEEIYSHSLQMGFDYQNSSSAVTLINSVTSRNDSPEPAKIEQNLAQGEDSYRNYYWTHRLGDSDLFYNIGQVLSTHPAAIKEAGYASVVTFRPNGEPTARLPSDPATGAVENYEFSDDNGNYDVIMEEKAMRSAGLKFLYLPLVSGDENTWTQETFDKYSPLLKKASEWGPVLVHCASGYRSSSITLTYLASLQGQCSQWVIDQARVVGFDLDSASASDSDKQVVAFAKQVLGC